MKRIFSSIKHHGEDNCFLSLEHIFSKEIFLETVMGKRVLLCSTSTLQALISWKEELPLRKKMRCNIHLSGPVFERVPFGMLFNRNFDTKMKAVIDSK